MYRASLLLELGSVDIYNARAPVQCRTAFLHVVLSFLNLVALSRVDRGQEVLYYALFPIVEGPVPLHLVLRELHIVDVQSDYSFRVSFSYLVLFGSNSRNWILLNFSPRVSSLWLFTGEASGGRTSACGTIFTELGNCSIWERTYL